MNNKIALKLLAYFAVALTVFAVVCGVLFQTMFTRRTMETKKAAMLARATALADTLSSARKESAAGMNGGAGMNGTAMGYGVYMRVLSQVETNVWVLDENLQFLTLGHMKGRAIAYGDLPTDAETLVRAVFNGETPFSEGFSKLVGAPTLTVGAPIYDGARIVGALLLHDAVSGIRAAEEQGVTALLLSGAAALLAAVLLATLLSWHFAKPLNRMRQTAQRLTDGDYAARTGVARPDEIGRLAQAMDGLGVRLADARDASEREEQLRRDFLANVSHELRTPVTVLRGSLEALCDGVVTDGAQTATYHRQMLRETVALQRLVNDLMDLARLQNTDFPVERAPLNMAEVLSDALYGAGQLAREKQIRIERQFTVAPVAFSGDYGRLRQMFLVVLHNAIKFSPPGTTVTVTLTERDAAIRDEGPGIAREEIPLLFDRFHKARTAENNDGSGLGLAIARQIALRQGIGITVESELGHGATFRFSWGTEKGKLSDSDAGPADAELK